MKTNELIQETKNNNQLFLEKLEQSQNVFSNIEKLLNKLNSMENVKAELNCLKEAPMIVITSVENFLVKLKYKKNNEEKIAFRLSVVARGFGIGKELQKEVEFQTYEVASSFVESLVGTLIVMEDEKRQFFNLEWVIETLESDVLKIHEFEEDQMMPYEYPSFFEYKMGIFNGVTSYILERKMSDVPDFVIQYRRGERVLCMSSDKDVFLNISEEGNMEKNELIFLLISYMKKMHFYKEKNQSGYNEKKILKELAFALEFYRELGSRVNAVELESYIWEGNIYMEKKEYQYQSIPTFNLKVILGKEIKIEFKVNNYVVQSNLDYFDDFDYDATTEEIKAKMKKLKDFYVIVSTEVARVGFELNKNFLDDMYNKVFVQQNHQTSMEKVAEVMKASDFSSRQIVVSLVTTNRMYFQTDTCDWKIQLQEDGKIDCFISKNRMYSENILIDISESEAATEIANRIIFLMFSIQD